MKLKGSWAPAVALMVVCCGHPVLLQAGIVRNVLQSVGLSKPDPPRIDPATGLPALPRNGFACCNLHNDGNSINDGNYARYPLIPAGTPIEGTQLQPQRGRHQDQRQSAAPAA